MITKLLGAIIFFGVGFLACRLTTERSQPLQPSTKNCVQQTPAQQIIKLIENDFQTLSKTNQLPLGWFSISKVETKINSQLANALLGQERPSFKRIKEGSNYLELEIIDLPDEMNPGIIVQASLFDLRSNNKIFEIGRTYKMSELNQQVANSSK